VCHVRNKKMLLDGHSTQFTNAKIPA
jgi:hypothetical protein